MSVIALKSRSSVILMYKLYYYEVSSKLFQLYLRNRKSNMNKIYSHSLAKKNTLIL